MDWLVSGGKDSRPGLSLPLGTFSAELGGEACKQEVAWGPLEEPGETLHFLWETAGNISLQHVSRVPSRWLTPVFLFPPPLSPPSSFSPASAHPFSSQSQLPLGGLGGSECSQPPHPKASPRWRFQSAGVIELGHPVGSCPLWSDWK